MGQGQQLWGCIKTGSTSLVAQTKMLAIKMQKSGQSQDILWKWKLEDLIMDWMEKVVMEREKARMTSLLRTWAIGDTSVWIKRHWWEENSKERRGKFGGQSRQFYLDMFIVHGTFRWTSVWFVHRLSAHTCPRPGSKIWYLVADQGRKNVEKFREYRHCDWQIEITF